MELKEYYFFSSLDDNELRNLHDISLIKRYSKGENLFNRGDESKYLHFLIKGVAKLYSDDIVNKNQKNIVQNINAPSLIQETANFEEGPFLLNCTFEVNSEVLLIDYKKFKKEFLHKKDISMLFIKSLNRKIKSLEKFIHTNIAVDINAKIAKFLYENENFLDSIKQVKMAEILNIREETLSRKIAKLIKDGIIRKEKRTIQIIDHQRLLNEFV